MSTPCIDRNGEVTFGSVFVEDDTVVGTSLVGYLNTTYELIRRVFGLPTGAGDGYKVDAEWEVYTPEGVLFIYNWKDGYNYLGDEGLNLEDITSWHIGAASHEPVKYLHLALKKGVENGGVL